MKTSFVRPEKTTPRRFTGKLRCPGRRARDHDDLASLWRHTGFASAREAVDAMYQAYPAAPKDEYLESFVADIAAQATS